MSAGRPKMAAWRTTWPQAHIDALCVDYDLGHSYEYLAAAYLTSRGTIAAIAKALGWTRREMRGHGPRRWTGRKRKGLQHPGTRKSRRCLMHGGLFMSDGPGHRICPPCRKSAEYAAGDHDESACPGLSAEVTA